MDFEAIKSKLYLVIGLICIMALTIALIAFFAPRELNRESSAAYKRGKQYFKERDFESAMYAFRTVVENHPEFAPGHYNLGCAYDAQGLVPLAMKSYKKAIDLHPEYRQALFNLAKLYDVSGHQRKAIFYYRQLLELEPNHTEALLSLIHDYARTNQVENARVHLEAARLWLTEDGDLHRLDELEDLVDDVEMRLMREQVRLE